MRSSTRLLCWLLLACTAGPVQGETLPEAVGRALARFPDFRAVLANRRAADEVLEQARGAIRPSIDATLGAGRETSNNVTTRALGRDASLTRQEAEVSVSQLLFDGGAASGQVRRFDARAVSAAYQAANAAETLGLRVAVAYFELLRLRGQVALAVQSAEAHERTLRQVETLARGGAGRRSDAQQAAARHALALASLAQQQGQFEQAQAAYRHLVGPPAGELRTPTSFEQALPSSLELALETAASSHPAVRAAERDLLSAHAERESARARLGPRVNLELGASQNRDLDGLRGANADRQAMVRMRYNLYRGGADEARIREAEARVDEALANIGRAKNDTERDLRQAWETLRADRARMPQLAIHAGLSVQVVEAYRAQFRIGQRSLLDVLNAESEQITARGNVINGLFAIAADEIRILAGMGKLLETLGVALPDEAKINETPR